MRLFIVLFLCSSMLCLGSFSSMSYSNSNNQDRTPDETIVSGGLQRYTFQHFAPFSYGSNFVLGEMSTANFESQSQANAFMAWNPSLSLSKLSDKNISWGIIKDVSLSFGLERGYDYKAEMGGLGLSLDIPSFNYVKVNILYKHNNVNSDNHQLVLAWDKAFVLGVPWRFTGFMIHSGTDMGTSYMAEPQLMLEGKVFGKAYKQLLLGLSLYVLNETQTLDQHIPTLVLKWNW